MSHCQTCDNSGYLDINPTVYCNCDAGDFYESRDERNLQIQEGFLDIGQDDEYNIDEHDSNNQSSYYGPDEQFEAFIDLIRYASTYNEYDEYANINHLVTIQKDIQTSHKDGTCECEEGDVADITCDKCNSSGYLSTTPIRYCDCAFGLWYNGKFKESCEILQKLCPNAEYLICPDEYNKNIQNCDWLYELPFYQEYN